jgi:HSP20 family protein
MRIRKESSLVPRQPFGMDPFGMLRQMATDMDRLFDESVWPSLRRPFTQRLALTEGVPFSPSIDVFEKENRLVTKIDLPGMKKEDVTIEVTDGQLTVSGERKRESEEKKENVYRAEREYGSFYRSVPLPEGVKFEDVKATFADGVLEVSVPLPAQPKAAVHKVPITAPDVVAKKSAA